MKRRRSEEGYALIIVIWTLVILSIILVNLVNEIELSTLLTSNDLDQRRLRQAAQAGIEEGIYTLKLSQQKDPLEEVDWQEEIKGDLDGLQYRVEIEEIGSRLNINYTSYKTLRELSLWDEEWEEELSGELVAEIILVKDLFGDSYLEAKELLTTYGRFNLNRGRLSGLRKILERLGVSSFQSDLIIEGLRELRREEVLLDSVDELLMQIEGLDLITFEQLKSEVGVEGSMNINYVHQDIIKAVFQSFHIRPTYREQLLEYREAKEVESLSGLEEFITREDLIKLGQYFNTSSEYFLIKSRANLPSGANKEISARVKEDSKLKIIRWSEE